MNTLAESLDMVQIGTRNFYSDCYDFAEKWVRNKSNFTSEDIIADFVQLNNFRPAEIRVWGPVMVKLKSAGLIRKVGVGTYRGVQGHAKPTNIWSAV